MAPPLDFPASPTANQIFRAPNGVSYMWDATRTLWLAQPSSMPNIPPGDFFATVSGTPPTVGTSAAVYVFNNVVSGNVGGWYATGGGTPGRYTPPAGRYNISAGFTVTNAAQSVQLNIFLRKNGADVTRSGGSSAGAGLAIEGVVEATLDMSGTDYVEIFTQGNVTGTVTAPQAWFTAIPVGVVVAMPATGQGDFCAQGSGALPTTLTTITAFTILSGNSGGWLNAGGTGRYTPPAGRYAIYAWMTAASSGGATQLQLVLRKNGTAVTPTALHSTGAAAFQGYVSQSATVDCNGTDWVDVQCAGTVATTTANQIIFAAYPISGVQGPPGPPGVTSSWRQLKRVVPTAGQATVDILGADIPSDINDLMCSFDLMPATADDNLRLQFFNAAGSIVTTGYLFSIAGTNSSQAGGASSFITSSTSVSNTSAIFLSVYIGAGSGINNGSGGGIRGSVRIPNIRDTARVKVATYDAVFFNNAATAQNSGAGGGQLNVNGAISGLRLLFGGGNFAAGGAITLWGSP